MCSDWGRTAHQIKPLKNMAMLISPIQVPQLLLNKRSIQKVLLTCCMAGLTQHTVTALKQNLNQFRSSIDKDRVGGKRGDWFTQGIRKYHSRWWSWDVFLIFWHKGNYESLLRRLTAVIQRDLNVGIWILYNEINCFCLWDWISSTVSHQIYVLYYYHSL